MRKLCCLAVTLLCPTLLPAESEGPGRGFVFYERFQGSANSAGLVTKLDTSVGYNFNKYWGVDAGLPVYFVRPSTSTSTALGTASRNGIGNAYGDVRLALASPAVNFISVLTAAAPTGDKAAGFSTGRPTYDWTNHFDRSFSRLTPFANLGVANTISDTPFFIRPFTSLGFVGHLEGGAEYRIVRGASIGASAYKIAPSGQQRIVSRLVHGSGSGVGRGNGSSHRQTIETPGETLVSADVASDHGFSTWLSLRPARYMEFELGYSRSVPFEFDTFFFGAGFNLGSIFRKVGH